MKVFEWGSGGSTLFLGQVRTITTFGKQLYIENLNLAGELTY